LTELTGCANSADSNVVNNTLATNYYGTLQATQIFLPLIKHGGRLINVASMTGKLFRYPTAIRERFLSAKSIVDITALMEDFRKSVAMGTEAKEGWPRAAYAVSKAGIIGFTRAIAQEEAKKESGILINSCCPGYVNTDMTRGNGVKTPDEGAQTPLLLALGDIGDRAGLFWENGRPSEW
jgi:carbonyl reductase 1